MGEPAWRKSMRKVEELGRQTARSDVEAADERERQAAYFARQREVCKSKVAYASFGHAQGAVNVFAETNGWKRRAYRCPICHLWHLTSLLAGGGQHP